MIDDEIAELERKLRAAKKARRVAAQKAAWAKSATRLPDMTADQLKKYRGYRMAGHGRDDALNLAGVQ